MKKVDLQSLAKKYASALDQLYLEAENNEQAEIIKETSMKIVDLFATEIFEDDELEEFSMSFLLEAWMTSQRRGKNDRN